VAIIFQALLLKAVWRQLIILNALRRQSPQRTLSRRSDSSPGTDIHESGLLLAAANDGDVSGNRCWLLVRQLHQIAYCCVIIWWKP